MTTTHSPAFPDDVPIKNRRAILLSMVGCGLASALWPDDILAQGQGAARGVPASTAHGFGFDGLTGGRVELSAYRGRALMVVNTASQCGFTGQYRGLQVLWQTWRGRGLTIIGVPSNDFGGQEPGSAGEIARFCEINYGVTFPMAARTPVTGAAAHPFYRWAEASFGAAARPRWNFHKILIGPDGLVRAAFPSAVEPSDPRIAQAITAALPIGRRPTR